MEKRHRTRHALLAAALPLCLLAIGTPPAGGDTVIIEGVVNGLPRLIYASGGALRRLTNGQLQLYGAVFGLGVVLIFVIVYFSI